MLVSVGFQAVNGRMMSASLSSISTRTARGPPTPNPAARENASDSAALRGTEVRPWRGACEIDAGVRLCSLPCFTGAVEQQEEVSPAPV